MVDKIELIEKRENFPEFLVSFGDSEKDIPKKIAYYTWALKIDGDNASIWSKLGYAYLDSEEHNKALKALDCAGKALELDKENIDGYRIKATVLLKTAKTESDLGGVLENFLRVVERDAGDAMAYANISWLTYKLGNLKFAVDNYDKALGIDHNILDKVPVSTHVTLFKGFEELNPQKYEAIRKGLTAVSTGSASAPASKAVVRKHVVKKVVQPPVKPAVSTPPAPPVQKQQDLEDEGFMDLEEVDEGPAKKPDTPTESKQAKKTDDDDNDDFECPECGAIIGEDDKKCPECGAEFE